MAAILPDDIPACGCVAPGTTDAATCYCSVEDLLRILRRRYSLVVMRAIHGRPEARYHEIESAVPGISSSTLAETLRALEAARLIDRIGPLDTVPRTFYRLTASGEKLLYRLRRLLDEVQEA